MLSIRVPLTALLLNELAQRAEFIEDFETAAEADAFATLGALLDQAKAPDVEVEEGSAVADQLARLLHEVDGGDSSVCSAAMKRAAKKALVALGRARVYRPGQEGWTMAPGQRRPVQPDFKIDGIAYMWVERTS